MGPNFISPESVKNIVYIGKKTNKSKSRYDLLKIAKRKRKGKFGLLGHLGLNFFFESDHEVFDFLCEEYHTGTALRRRN
jgi:hypothetical protein